MWNDESLCVEEKLNLMTRRTISTGVSLRLDEK